MQQNASANVAAHHNLDQVYHFLDRGLFLTERRLGVPLEFKRETDESESDSSPSRSDDDDYACQVHYRWRSGEDPRSQETDVVMRDMEGDLVELHASRILHGVRRIVAALKDVPSPQATHLNSNGPVSSWKTFVPSSASDASPCTEALGYHNHHNPTANGGGTSRPVSPCAVSSRSLRSPWRGNRFHPFARKRLGKILADVVMSCSSVATAASLSTVEEQAQSLPSFCSPPPPPLDDLQHQLQQHLNTGLLDPTSDAAQSLPLRRRSVGISHASHGAHAQPQSCDITADEIIRDFVTASPRPQTTFSDAAPGSGPNDSDFILPFLAFDTVVNSFEDLTLYEDEDTMYRSMDSIERATGGAGPTFGLQQARPKIPSAPYVSRSVPSSLASGSMLPKPSSSSQLALGHGSFPPPPLPTRQHPPSNMNPCSPCSSSFKPALSFTSMEGGSPLFPFAHHSPRVMFPMYAVDEPSVTIFLNTLRSIRVFASDPNQSEEEFEELGLRFAIPGIMSLTFGAPASANSAAVSMAASPQIQPVPAFFLPHTDSGGQLSRLSSMSGHPAAVQRRRSVSASEQGGYSSFVHPPQPGDYILPLIEGGASRRVKLIEFSIFEALVHKTLAEVDATTGNQHHLVQRFQQK